MCVTNQKSVSLSIIVSVVVNPNDDALLETIRDSGGTFSIMGIVRAEIESNFESVSYVLHARAE